MGTQKSTGRERLATVRAEQERAARQRRLLGLVAVLVVLVLVGVLAMWFISRDTTDNTAAADADAVASAQVIDTVTSLPAATFDAVGRGGALASPTPLSGSAALTEDGKPRVLYVGAEFCPFCAMERWSLVAALSRFGTFEGLKGSISSSDEGELSDIQTLSFLDATYTSAHVALTTYETSDRERAPLQTLSGEDEALFGKHNPQGGIPWIDWGGDATSGVGFDGRLLVGKSAQAIASALEDPTSEIAQAVLGSANVETAQICALTKGEPADVCDSPGVKAASGTFAR